MATLLDLSDRTVVLTGATSGIGRATALALARHGPRLHLVARNAGRAQDVRKEIEEQPGAGPVEIHLADLSSLAEIRRVAAEILAACPAIHLLINNAGVVHLRRTVTVDGYETTFAVNHLAYFLLTLLLLDRIRESAPARIVNVASDAHRFGSLDWDDLQSERRYRGLRVYGASKLANILFTRELARRLEGSGVTANCLHPGGVATGLGGNHGLLSRILLPLVRPLLRTPEEGAKTTIHLATSLDVDGVSGRYYANCREVTPSGAARDDAAAKRLWRESLRLTGLPESP